MSPAGKHSHLAGAEAEVDFGEVAVRLRGELVKCHLFCLRLSFSGKAVHRVFASGGQKAFFEGHEHAFRVLGGVPFGKIGYDNLKAAVASVLGFTRRRVETDRWTAFRSHYGIEPFYCTPGIEGAHEKAGVEGQIGRVRRNHFVPVSEIDSLAQLNMLIDEWDLADEARRIGTRPRTIGELFAVERPSLKPLPVETFETRRWFTPRVDRFSQITVRTNRYSVPARFIGRQVRVLLHASELVVFDGRTEIAQHERPLTKSGSRLEVLLLHRHLQHDHVVAGLAAALQVGALTADAAALEARRIADNDEPTSAKPRAEPLPRQTGPSQRPSPR